MSTTINLTTVPVSVPLLTGNQLMIVEHVGGDMVYYRSTSNVGPQTNDGVLLLAQTTQFYSGPVWFASASTAQIIVTYVSSPITPESIVAVGSAAPGAGATGDVFLVRSDGATARFTPPAVSAKTYLAVGDGIADDTTAIQAAITAAKGVVFLPAGVYKVTSSLSVPFGTNGLVIRGAGSGLTGAAQTTINYTGTGACFTLGGGTSGNFTRFQFIEDLEIVGTSAASGAVRFFSTRWCGVRRCVIRNFSGAGVAGVLIDGDNVLQYPNYFNRIEQCWFDTMPWGVYLRGDSSGAGANSNVIAECDFTSCTTNGVLIDGGDTNRIMVCEFSSGTGVGVSITAVNTPAIYNSILLCQFDGASGGVSNSGTQTQLIGNTGANYTVTDSGTSTTRIDKTVRTPVAVAAYSASITPDASAGVWQTITVTNATAFTINAPSSPPSSGTTQELTIEVRNSSGGAMGVITWNAAFVFPTGAWANPASTKKRFARFEWNGAVWACTSVATADY